MGYTTIVTGEIEIRPPIPGKALKCLHLEDRDVRLHIVERVKETDEGDLIQKEAVGVLPWSDESYKAYSIVEHLQELVSLFPGHEFLGYLEGEGEENSDMWRLRVKDGKATKVKPTIVWPED